MNNHLANNQAKTDALGWVISATAFLYVVGAYTLRAIPNWSRANVLLALLLALLLVLRALSDGRLSVPRYLAIPCAFLAFAALSMVWAPGPSEASWDVIMTSSSMLGALGIWVATQNGLSWRTIAWACVVGGLIDAYSAKGEVAAMGLGGRAAGLAANANSLAMLLSYAALIIWCVPANGRGTPRGGLFGKLSRWGAGLLGVGFVAYAELFTGSRKTLLVTTCVALLVLVHVLPRLRRPMTWLWLALGCWFAVVAFAVIDSYREEVATLGTAQSVQRMEAILSGKTSSPRIEMIYEALELWRQQPVLGHGAGQYAVLGSFQVYSHNNYTELLVNFGVVGFALYYLLHAFVLVKAFRGLLRGSAPHRSAFVLILTILLLDMAMVTYLTKVSWLFLAFTAGLATSASASRAPSRVPARRVRRMRPSAAAFLTRQHQRPRPHLG